jgi:hypothetical protein
LRYYAHPFWFLLSIQRLGHESLLKKRESLMYAESIALKKVGDQPEKKVALDSNVLEMGMVSGM